MGDRVLGQNGKAVGGNKLRYSVVDLRIHVVGTPGQHDSVTARLLHPLQYLLAFFLHILSGGHELCPALMGSRADLFFGDGEVL